MARVIRTPDYEGTDRRDPVKRWLPVVLAIAAFAAQTGGLVYAVATWKAQAEARVDAADARLARIEAELVERTRLRYTSEDARKDRDLSKVQFEALARRIEQTEAALLRFEDKIDQIRDLLVRQSPR